MSDEYKLFPGCVIQNRYPYLEASAKFVFEKVGIVTSPGKFACCPNPVGIKLADNTTWAAIAASNIVEAEKENKPIISLCNGCYQSLALAKIELHHDKQLKEKVNGVLSKIGKEYKGTVDINHFVTVLHDKVGLEKIKSLVKKPLKDLKVCLHPGCHYARPSKLLKQEDDPFNLKYLRELVEAAGATVLDYPLENQCCGNSIKHADEYTANNMMRSKIRAVKDAGADAIALNCPACFNEFEMQQGLLRKMKDAQDGETFKMPSLYVTEILALAMGGDANALGIKFHRNKNPDLLGKL